MGRRARSRRRRLRRPRPRIRSSPRSPRRRWRTRPATPSSSSLRRWSRSRRVHRELHVDDHYASKATRTGSYGTPQQITFSTRPGGGAIGAASTVPRMRSASSSFRWATRRRPTARSGRDRQQALQDGMTAAVAASIRSRGHRQSRWNGRPPYMVAPTLINLRNVGGLNLLDGTASSAVPAPTTT